MSFAISSDTLETFKSKNLRLIFCIGFPGSGLESQIEKVSNEFKYNKICILSSIKKETKIDTDLGKSLKEYSDKGESYPKDLLINLIINKSLECGNNKTILISGLQNNLEEAQYFEEKIGPIELILKFNASKETCIHNLKEIPECKINEEELGKKYDEILNIFNSLKEFYSPYSLIREIDCNKSIDEINSLLKQNLYPIIYSIIGKRYSGKTTLGQILKGKMGIDTLDFNEFLIKNSINKKQLSKAEKEKEKENEIIVNKLILKLRQMRTLRILIEDFPQNKEQYIFLQQLKKIPKNILFRCRKFNLFRET